MTLVALLLMIGAGLAGFAYLLAVQMRIFSFIVLRRALKAWDGRLNDQDANKAVVFALDGEAPDGAPDWLSSSVAHLRATYPRPLSHIRLARTTGVVAPLIAIALLVLLRWFVL